MRVLGKNLRVGDTIAVWWSPGRDTITGIEVYSGPLTCFKQGARLMTFATNRSGMTIANDEYEEVVARGNA